MSVSKPNRRQQDEEAQYLPESGQIFQTNRKPITLGEYNPARQHMTVAPGLNFEAICTDGQCTLKGRIVWVQKGFGVFYIGHTLANLNCPICKKKIKYGSGKGLGYTKAKVKFTGKRDEEQEQIVIEDQELDGKFIKYEGYDGQTCKWNYLIAQVTKL